MARANNVALQNGFKINPDTATMLDPEFGGQQGYAPNLSQWVSNQAYVKNNLVCILLEPPRFFQVMPNPEKWTAVLKSILETHSKKIEGFKAGLTAEFEEHEVGGAGEMQQELTDVKRDRTEPSFIVTEKEGRPIQNFLHQWIQYGMMDPDTKTALAGTLSNLPSDFLADWYTATILVFEPDKLHKKVVKSWITTNMMPKATGDIDGGRDLSSSKEILEITIEFTGISQTGEGTNRFAQQLLNNIVIENANPYLRAPFISQVDSNVKAAGEGYESSATRTTER